MTPVRDERPRVAIVGGGFSGLMTALHLLERPGGPRVHLVERRAEVGRGVAYARGPGDYRLNVRARNMSAWPERRSHFADWLAAADGGSAIDFATRTAYGDYLASLLQEATAAAPDGLVVHADTATDLVPTSSGWTLHLAGGDQVAVAAAVLAVGNLPPAAPGGVEAEALASAAYVADPWAADLSTLPSAGCAVLLGTGLTMIDVALRLARVRPELKLLAISRRGLLPRRHLLEPPADSTWRAPETLGPLLLMRALRAQAGREDWRAVMDTLRPHAQAIWRGWSLAERRRFLRHGRPWWDVHRHRLAPEVAARLDHRIDAGDLSIRAGRLLRVSLAPGGLEVAWRPRHAEARTLSAAAFINCSGPNADLRRVDDPLIRELATQGLIRSDACRLGFDVDDHGRLVRESGDASADLFAVGPLTRGASWEITSVPDIRAQAAACADQVRAVLARDRPAVAA